MKSLKKAAMAIMASIFVLPFSLRAQQYEYDITKGEKLLNHVTVKVTPNANGSVVDVVTGQDRHTIQTLDKNNVTISWRCIEQKNGTDYTVSKSAGKYHIKGKLNGKDIDKTENTSGSPWHQMISMTGAKILANEGDKVEYECVRPEKASIVTMSATHMGKTSLGGKAVVKIKAATAGVIAGIWSCLYYNDAASKVFLRYEGVEGVPGSKTTVWNLK